MLFAFRVHMPDEAMDVVAVARDDRAQKTTLWPL